MGSRKKTKTTEITIERSDVFAIRKLKSVTFGRCPECRTRVELVTPEDAASMAGVSPRAVYRWVEIGKVHFTETREGSLLVCRNSLPTG